MSSGTMSTAKPASASICGKEVSPLPVSGGIAAECIEQRALFSTGPALLRQKFGEVSVENQHIISPRCLNARKVMVWGALRSLRVLMSEGNEVSA